MREYEAEQIIFPNLDGDLLIINTKEDFGGGDTAQREGMWHYGMMKAFPEHRDRFATGLQASCNKLQLSDGRFVRHPAVPGAPGWYSDPSDFSRDQSIPLVIALGEGRLKEKLGAFANRTRANGLKAQNGDIFWAPHHLGMWWRSLHQCGLVNSWIYILLLFTDISLLLASIFAVVYSHLHKNHSDDLNFTMMLMQSNYLATPVGAVARLVFANYRAPMQGTYERWGPASALEAYFSPMIKDIGAPRIDYLYNKSGILKNLIQ